MYRWAFLLLLFGCSQAQIRKMSLEINPGCSGDECPPEGRALVHVRGEGSNDTLHHIWDLRGKPAVLLALTSPTAQLKVNWTLFKDDLPHSISFEPSQDLHDVFAFTLDQLYEFDDSSGRASFDPRNYSKTDVFIFGSHNFHWRLDGSKTRNETDLCSVVVEGKFKHHGTHKTNGSVFLTLSGFGKEEHSEVQPHLLHSTNVTQIELVVDGLSTSESRKPRLALLLTLLTSDPASSSANLTEHKSLDDEHSPGVFNIGEVLTKTGYLTWREVAYTSRERLMTSSVGVQAATYPRLSNSSFQRTVIGGLYSSDEVDHHLTKSVVFIYGVPNDPLYTATNYLSWTVLGGLGRVEEDSLSFAAILISVLGIGLPLLLILLLTCCIVVKRISKKSHDIVFAEN